MLNYDDDYDIKMDDGTLRALSSQLVSWAVTFAWYYIAARS